MLDMNAGLSDDSFLIDGDWMDEAGLFNFVKKNCSYDHYIFLLLLISLFIFLRFYFFLIPDVAQLQWTEIPILKKIQRKLVLTNQPKPLLIFHQLWHE